MEARTERRQPPRLGVNPLYVTARAEDGTPMFGGIFRMHDQMGFSVDQCIELSKERGFLIDWLEALCDCWLNDCLKYESFLRQAASVMGVDPQILHAPFSQATILVWRQFPKILNRWGFDDPTSCACRYILAKKRRHSWA